MNDRILVTYATRTGSTVGVAEAIGKTLAEGGALVDVRPMQDVKDLTPYWAVVAGSAIQNHKWLPEAMQFMQTHQKALADKTFAAFLVCLTMILKNVQPHLIAAEWMTPIRTLKQPISEGYFAGVLDISKIPSRFDRIAWRLSIMMGTWAEGDHRDWNAIRAWSVELKSLLEGQRAPQQIH